MTTELEAKLIPDDRFRMPAFEILAEGAVVVPLPIVELDATYYDTVDLELARWGITLRYREGEPGPPWTLKLPVRAASGLIVREELGFEGPIDAMPDEAMDLVRAFTRGSPLTDVARLHTSRAPVQVRDTDGHTLIEIVDDSVTSVGMGELDQFHELEVEALADSTFARVVFRAAVSALILAGCHAGEPLPKAVRALGRRAQEPPSVVVAPVGRHASTIDLVRHLTAASVSQILVHDPGVRLGLDPEAVHQYRVATRRLRSDLRTFSRLLDDAPTSAVRDDLRWLGAAVGPVRDLDVLGARFAANARGLSDLDQPAASALQARVAAARIDAHQCLLGVLRSERYDGALRALVEFASEPPIAPGASRKETRGAATLGPRLVAHRWNQVAAAVEAAGGEPSDEELHRIRIAAKRCRYATEAVVPVMGRPARRFAAGIEEVQTVLGDYHDTVVAEAWLRDAAVDLVDSRVAIGGLISAERRERERLREAWPAAWHRASRPKNREWL